VLKAEVSLTSPTKRSPVAQKRSQRRFILRIGTTSARRTALTHTCRRPMQAPASAHTYTRAHTHTSTRSALFVSVSQFGADGGRSALSRAAAATRRDAAAWQVTWLDTRRTRTARGFLGLLALAPTERRSHFLTRPPTKKPK
jgi:hypothetical protein